MFYLDRAKKANIVAPLVKPCTFGLPYSFHDIQSSSLAEGIAVMMHTVWMRDTDQSWPVYLSNSYFYQLGPLNREPFTVCGAKFENEFPILIQSFHFLHSFPCGTST